MTKTVSLAECPVGLFYAASGALCFKSEYGSAGGRIDAYVVRTGEFFWGGTTHPKDQRALPVTPVSHADLILSGVDAPGPVAEFLVQVADEIERAAMLWPGPNPNLAALGEEVGELNKAFLEAYISIKRLRGVTPDHWEEIRTEAVQVAAMAFRTSFEGDYTMGVVPQDSAP